MKLKFALIVLTVCSGLMTGPSFADSSPLFGNELTYSWPPANCWWDGGCRYTYQVPNPPAGKKWVFQLRSNHPVNDRKVWMVGGNRKVAMAELGQESGTNMHNYGGTMPTGGEIEFWMPRAYDGRDQNKAWIRATLANAN